MDPHTADTGTGMNAEVPGYTLKDPCRGESAKKEASKQEDRKATNTDVVETKCSSADGKVAAETEVEEPITEIDPTVVRIVQFRIGHSRMTGIGVGNVKKHPQVLHVNLFHSTLDLFLMKLFEWLPASIRALVVWVFPEYLLPARLVIKKLKPGSDDRFDNEIRMYGALQYLQGNLIPTFYGEARCQGTRAIVLSRVDGVVPFLQEEKWIATEELRARIEILFHILVALGLSLGDTRLESFMITQKGVVLIDLSGLRDADHSRWREILDLEVGRLAREYTIWYNSPSEIRSLRLSRGSRHE